MTNAKINPKRFLLIVLLFEKLLVGQTLVLCNWSDAFDDSFATYLAKFVDRVSPS
jgi:hypothetical protein